MAAIRLDLPALGKPTSPMSATTLSSRTMSSSSPGSPSRAKPGALRWRRPARRCRVHRGRPRRRSARCRVPPGRRAPRRARARPCRRAPGAPGRHRGRRSCAARALAAVVGARFGLWWYSTSVVTSGSTRRIIEPPGPPLPPSGPPSGLNFSRCTEATPCPPRPALHEQRDPVDERRDCHGCSWVSVQRGRRAPRRGTPFVIVARGVKGGALRWSRVERRSGHSPGRC